MSAECGVDEMLRLQVLPCSLTLEYGFYERKAALQVAVAPLSGVQRHEAQFLCDYPVPKGTKIAESSIYTLC